MVQKTLDDALRKTNIARDAFAYKYGWEFDVDWVMDQFASIVNTLERLREYAGEVDFVLDEENENG